MLVLSLTGGGAQGPRAGKESGERLRGRVRPSYDEGEVTRGGKSGIAAECGGGSKGEIAQRGKEGGKDEKAGSRRGALEGGQRTEESVLSIKRTRGGYTDEERRQLLPQDKWNPYKNQLGSPKGSVKATPVAETKKVEETQRDQQEKEEGKEPAKKKQRRKRVREPTSVSAEKLQESREKIRDLAWGKESTRKQADRNRRIYEEAMTDMKIPEEKWYVFDVINFESFAAWMLANEGCNYAVLDPWSSLLNNVRSREFADSSRPWKDNKTIQDLKSAYRDAEEVRRENEGIQKDQRVCMPAEAFIEMIDQAEVEIAKQEASEEGNAIIGITAGQIVQTLFVIRGSTLGAAKTKRDIWVDEKGLNLVIRKIKGWKKGKQHSTGWRLPVSRTAQLNEHVPWGDDIGHIRSRCLIIVEEALKRKCFFRWSGPDQAASEISKDIKNIGRRNVAVGKVISSHTGRKTGVSILRGMGIDPGIVQRWMLVSSIKVVEYYRDQDYISNKAMRDLFDWMKTKKK